VSAAAAETPKLLARIDLNLVLQACIAAVLLWAVREAMDARDTAIITQVEVRANTAAIERVTVVLDRLSVMQERLARVEAMLDQTDHYAERLSRLEGAG
jgi:hypothetical protein